MKKMNNKGFSLVELIIVIAIMAILAGAIAPALIKYIEKSRVSNDTTTAATLKESIETAMGNEAAYEQIYSVAKASGNKVSFTCKQNFNSGSAMLNSEVVETISTDDIKIKAVKTYTNGIYSVDIDFSVTPMKVTVTPK